MLNACRDECGTIASTRQVSKSSRAHVPQVAFKAAYRDLCARIWIELELLAQIGRCAALDPMMSAAVLRLQLIVLVDSCRSLRWRQMLSTEQRDRLCSMLTDILAALYVDSEDLRVGIAEAQDRVLTEFEWLSCELTSRSYLTSSNQEKSVPPLTAIACPVM